MSKKCPYCAEQIQDEAIVCRYCGKELPKVNTQNKRAKPKPPAWATAIVLIGILGTCAFCAWGIPAQNKAHDAKETIIALTQTSTPAATRAPTRTPAPTSTKGPNELDSYEVGEFLALSEETVKQALKSPSTAKFPSLIFELDQWRIGKKGNVVTVASWVDAQNSFGAMIRNQFAVQYDYTTKDLLYLWMDGKILYGGEQK